METLRYQGYTGSIEASVDDGCLHGRVQFVRDVITYEGETIAQLEADFRRMVDVYLASCKQRGVEPNKPFSGSFNVRVTPEQHEAAAHAALRSDVSMNQWIAEAIRMRLEAERAAAAQTLAQAGYTIMNSMNANESWAQPNEFNIDDLVKANS